jgi:hypothetical protein
MPRVSAILAGQSMFRNKIPETLEPGCLCNEMKAPDHEQKLQLDCTEEPDFQETLDCDADRSGTAKIFDSFR